MLFRFRCILNAQPIFHIHYTWYISYTLHTILLHSPTHSTERDLNAHDVSMIYQIDVCCNTHTDHVLEHMRWSWPLGIPLKDLYYIALCALWMHIFHSVGQTFNQLIIKFISWSLFVSYAELVSQDLRTQKLTRATTIDCRTSWSNGEHRINIECF